MKSAHWRNAVPAAVLLGFLAGPALAQRPPSPEQRIAILEQRVAAGQAAAIRLEQRLDTIERQLQQLINIGEVNGHQVNGLRSEISKLRSDVDRRLTELESRPVPQPVVQAPPEEASADDQAPKVETAAASTEPPPTEEASEAEEASDPGEDSYSEGFHLWRDGQYDQAIVALRAFLSGFPDHRRASFARNLIGRALLDKGEPRPAAEALLANYRKDPKGERAPDSLYYLGKALLRLDQPGQACKAYAELEDVYGESVRPTLKTLVTEAKAEASCS